MKPDPIELTDEQEKLYKECQEVVERIQRIVTRTFLWSKERKQDEEAIQTN